MQFSKGAGENQLTYPLTQEQIDGLKPCGLHSPRVGNNHGIELPKILSTEEGLYQSSMEIMEVGSKVSRNEYPREFMAKYYPKEWGAYPEEIPTVLAREGLSYFNPQGLAHVVHMDLPTYFPNAVMKWLLSLDIQPEEANTNCVDFLEFVPETIEKVGNAVRRNLEMAFEVKYYYGIPRPEEVLGFNLTSYPEGCPPHCSFVAGHSAAAISTSVIAKRFGLDRYPEILAGLRHATYDFGMYRSLSRVHHAVDNIQFLHRL